MAAQLAGDAVAGGGCGWRLAGGGYRWWKQRGGYRWRLAGWRMRGASGAEAEGRCRWGVQKLLQGVDADAVAGGGRGGRKQRGGYRWWLAGWWMRGASGAEAEGRIPVAAGRVVDAGGGCGWRMRVAGYRQWLTGWQADRVADADGVGAYSARGQGCGVPFQWPEAATTQPSAASGAGGGVVPGCHTITRIWSGTWPPASAMACHNRPKPSISRPST